MKKYTINMHHVKNDDDSLGMKFPLNSYETSDPEKVVECIRGLLFNELSGINRVVILNGRLKEADAGQAKMDLDMGH